MYAHGIVKIHVATEKNNHVRTVDKIEIPIVSLNIERNNYYVYDNYINAKYSNTPISYPISYHVWPKLS